MERHVNTYQGINKDTAYDSLDPSMYIDAIDIRISTATGESIGGWTNIKGNKEAFVIPDSGTFLSDPPQSWTATNPEIIGYTTIRNRIILFVADDLGSQGWIYDVQYDPATREILPGFPVLKYYSDNLQFKKEWPIEALGRYETDSIQRIYWTDYNNYFRTINLEQVDLANFPLGQVDVFTDLDYTQPLLKVVTGGSLASGLYQIAYRLITQDGKETLVSPPSNIIHVVSDAESVTTSAQYNGDGSPVNSGKGLIVEIDTSTYTEFAQIEFISIYHANATATPLVLSVEKMLIGGLTTVNFVYTGTETGSFPLDLLEYTIKNNPFKTPKTITQKDSSMVIANIKGSSISVQDLLPSGESFDARTGRYLNDGTTLPFPLTGTPAQIEEKKLKNAFNSSVDSSLIPTRPEVGFNQDAHWDDNWQSYKQFKYKSDGITLGGEGPNISYKFHLEPFTLNGDTEPGFAAVSNTPDYYFTHNFNDGYGTYENTDFANFASPFLSGLMRGYKRGETYRFGIIFYTKKGEATFVEYIGDIKFPDISEEDSAYNSSETAFWPIARRGSTITGASDPDDIIGFNLGIEFTIDLSSCPSLLNQITGYQIVRVQREDSDKRRFSQGSVKGFYFAPIGSPEDPDNFDLRGPGSSTNVLHLYPKYPVDTSLTTGLRNGSFALLEDQETDPSPYTPVYEDYLVKGQYLGFYTPEISFNHRNARTILPNLASNPCLLLTGSYGYFVETIKPSVDLSDENIGSVCVDSRFTLKEISPVSFNSKENIKKWANVSLQNMPDDSDYTLKVTTDFNGYYMRNYYAIDNYPEAAASPGPDLNWPQRGGGNTDAPQINKAGTSIIGRLEKISTDFFTQQAITPSSYDYFKSPDLVYPIDPITKLPLTPYEEQFPIIDYLLPKIETYGGFNQNALENNIFIPASPVISTDNLVAYTHTFNVFGGDIFVNMSTLQTETTEFHTGFYDNNRYRQDNSRTEILPVESCMNLDLAYGSTLRTGVTYTYGTQTLTLLRQETDNSSTTYGKTTDFMYAYNSLYSRENQDVTFFVEPSTIKNNLVNDVRAYLSNVKYSGEATDSWTKFGANNFYDVDDYGPINKIVNYKDSVYFIQDRGFGVYAINRAAITTTADGVPTQLGTGEGFGKHQYHSKTHGSIHQWGVKSTDTGIYIFDAIARKIFMFASAGYQAQNSPLSEISGIHSWLQALPDAVFFTKQNGGDNPVLKKGMTIAKDIINDEIIFTFLGTGNYVTLAVNTTYTAGTIVEHNEVFYYVETTFTSGATKPLAIIQLNFNSREVQPEDNFRDDSIVYDELFKKFSTRFSIAPKIWIENGQILLTSNPVNKKARIVYTHNIGNWGEFYGVNKECSITLVINPQADMNKVLRTIEFNSIVRDDNKVIDRTATITAFRIQTQYQDTLKTPFSSGRIMRKFDKWRVKIPRDQLSAAKQGRLRSTYFILTLYFDNESNKELITNRLMSYFDYQTF